MADFSLDPMPNFAQAALGGFQAGQNIRKQQGYDAALQGVDLERPETALAVLRYDPATGAALINASTKIAADRRDREARTAQATWIKTLYGNGGPLAPQPSGGSGISDGDGIAAPPVTAGTPTTQDSQPGDIVVNAPSKANAARNAAIDADPESFIAMQGKIDAHLKAATEDQLKRAADTTNAVATVGQQALSMPYGQRKAYIQAQAGYLAQHGFNAQQIAAFDPTDDNIHSQIGQALGVKATAERELEERKFAETQKQHGIENGLAQQRIGLESQSVGISAGHLALDRQEAARKAGGTGGAGAGRRVIGGKTYYQVGGKWFDNPEGK